MHSETGLKRKIFLTEFSLVRTMIFGPLPIPTIQIHLTNRNWSNTTTAVTLDLARWKNFLKLVLDLLCFANLGLLQWKQMQ